MSFICGIEFVCFSMGCAHQRVWKSNTAARAAAWGGRCAAGFDAAAREERIEMSDYESMGGKLYNHLDSYPSPLHQGFPTSSYLPIWGDKMLLISVWYSRGHEFELSLLLESLKYQLTTLRTCCRMD